MPISHTLTDGVKIHVEVASHHCKEKRNMIISLCSEVVPTVYEGGIEVIADLILPSALGGEFHSSSQYWLLMLIL